MATHRHADRIVLSDQGLQNVTTFGVQAYLSAREPVGSALLAGVAKSLAPVIVERGIASAAEVDVETLEQRIADAVRKADAVILPPAVVGACGRLAQLRFTRARVEHGVVM